MNCYSALRLNCHAPRPTPHVMTADLTLDSAGRIKLTPASDSDADTRLQGVPGKRTVLRASGKPSDAAAAVRAERAAQAGRAGKRPA